jgi:hypothetical protein
MRTSDILHVNVMFNQLGMIGWLYCETYSTESVLAQGG